MTTDASRILIDVCRGDERAVDQLLPLVYDELKRIASGQLLRERTDHSLQATALVHEAYLRLVDQRSVDWKGRAHFCAVAATMIRRILVDHARGKAALKRGGEMQRQTLIEIPSSSSKSEVIDLLMLDEVMTELADWNERYARIAEMRYFAGLSVEETACALGLSARTVKQDWRVARAWLLARLKGTDC